MDARIVPDSGTDGLPCLWRSARVLTLVPVHNVPSFRRTAASFSFGKNAASAFNPSDVLISFVLSIVQMGMSLALMEGF
jgi:hypothetical protein